MNRFITENQTRQILRHIIECKIEFDYDYQKHMILIKDENYNELFRMRLPVTIPPPVQTAYKSPVKHVILLIRSGSCAMGLYSGEKNLDHKVFNAYMVRKKQGMSQVKYLKTRGKSRAGSRIRLAATVHFFEEINERLQVYFKRLAIDRIVFSCSKILLHYLFNSKIKCPFGNKDVRLLKVPRHIHNPDYAEMQEVYRFILKGELIYNNEGYSLFREIFEELKIE